MITEDVLANLLRWAPYYRPPMLMLGAQEIQVPGFRRSRDWFAQFVGDQYQELDLDGGDLKLDLNRDLAELSGQYATVFNLGTIEHAWDAHRAWSNTARAVAVGGTLLTLSPVGGWCDERGLIDHGLHMTEHGAITAFLSKNGFVVLDSQIADWRARGLLLWLAASKERHLASLEDFQPVYQVKGYAP